LPAADLTAAIDAAVRQEPRLRHLQSVIVMVDGDVRVERYFRGRTPHDLSNAHSVTKGVLSSLVGIAISDGALDLDTRVVDVLDGISRPFRSDRIRAPPGLERRLETGHLRRIP
jgi:CubicO group peptidase (beta-lactamase class C family)